MRSLVEQELVFQVIPEEYIDEIPNFERAFQVYLDKLGPEVARRQARFASGSTLSIHLEKMGCIRGTLVGLGLAQEVRGTWCEVESDTANDFMSYLATALGRLPSVGSSPVTNEAAYLDRLVRAGVPEDRVVQQLQSLRIKVLERVLPIPDHPVQPSVIREFKNKHNDVLRQFRRRVEKELVEATAIADGPKRQHHLGIFFEEAADLTEQIEAAMHGAGWQIIKGSLSVIAAIPGVSPTFGLAAALWDALSGGQRQAPSQDFAYAAYARMEL
jgi:hypothetical protein